MTRDTRCSAHVHNDFGVSFRQCIRRAVVTRNGKGYCRQHDPHAAAERRAAADAEVARVQRHRDLRATAEDAERETRSDLATALAVWLGDVQPVGATANLRRAATAWLDARGTLAMIPRKAPPASG